MENSDHSKLAPAQTQEGLNLRDLLQVLRIRRRLVLFFIAMSFLGTAFKTVFYVPTFTARTALVIQKSDNSPLQAALVNVGVGSAEPGDRLKKYLDYIQTNDFFMAVAENLKFQEGYHLLNLIPPGEMSLHHKQFWALFRATYFDDKRTKKRPTTAPEPVLVPVEQLASLIRSITQAEGSGTDTIRIGVTTLDPFTSMVVANTLTQVFVKKTTERDYNEVTEVIRFIQEQLDATTDRLKKSESALVEFKKRHNIISINASHEAFSMTLKSIESELETNKMKFLENEKLIEFYSSAIKKDETRLLRDGASSIKTTQGALIDRLRQKIDSLRYKKVLMQAQGYDENAWQMAEINKEINQTVNSLRDQLNKKGGSLESENAEDDVTINLEAASQKLSQLKSDNKVLGTKLSSIEKSKSNLVKTLDSLPKEEQALLTLSRNVELQFELYAILKKKLQEVEIQQVALQSHVQITERAGPPPPAPRTSFFLKTLFSILVGLFLGALTAFVLEAIDSTVKHTQDLESMELSTLGSIPHVAGSNIRDSLDVPSYRPDLLICKEKPESPESMAFKYIRTQILTHRGVDGLPTKVMTVTSPDRGDGKSFVASNLAVSLAQLEKKTLLIDCDFRGPSVPWYFGYPEDDGLTSLLNLKASLDEVLIREQAPYLDILPAGWVPQNPSELISNDKFKFLMEHLRSSYEFIIIDAPPAISVVDATVLAGLSDSVFLVAGFRRTKKDAILASVKKIVQVSNKHIYAVLNNLDEGGSTATSLADRLSLMPIRTQDPAESKAELEKFEKILSQRKVG